MQNHAIDRIQELIKQAEDAQLLNKLTTALQLFESAKLHISQLPESNSKHSMLLKVLYRLGSLQTILKNHQQSKEMYHLCIKTPRFTEEDSMMVSDAYILLGSQLSKQQFHEKALKYITKGISVLTNECKISSHYIQMLNRAVALTNEEFRNLTSKSETNHTRNATLASSSFELRQRKRHKLRFRSFILGDIPALKDAFLDVKKRNLSRTPQKRESNRIYVTIPTPRNFILRKFK